MTPVVNSMIYPGGLHIVFIFLLFLMRRYHLIGKLGERAPFYSLFWRSSPILLAIRERKPHFIGYLIEEAQFYLHCS